MSLTLGFHNVSHSGVSKAAPCGSRRLKAWRHVEAIDSITAVSTQYLGNWKPCFHAGDSQDCLPGEGFTLYSNVNSFNTRLSSNTTSIVAACSSNSLGVVPNSFVQCVRQGYMTPSWACRATNHLTQGPYGRSASWVCPQRCWECWQYPKFRPGVSFCQLPNFWDSLLDLGYHSTHSFLLNSYSRFCL